MVQQVNLAMLKKFSDVQCIRIFLNSLLDCKPSSNPYSYRALLGAKVLCNISAGLCDESSRVKLRQRREFDYETHVDRTADHLLCSFVDLDQPIMNVFDHLLPCATPCAPPASDSADFP